MYQYKKINHFTEKLKRFEGNENYVPDDILKIVKNYLDQHNLEINNTNIKFALRNQKLMIYYEHINEILKKLTKHNNLEFIKSNQPNKITLNELYECPVCFDETKEVIVLECNHQFCVECTNKLNKNNQISCPMCRTIHVLTSFGINDKKLCGCVLPEFTEEMVELLTNQFKIISEEYKSHVPPGRTNFLSYSYVLGKLLIFNKIMTYDQVDKMGLFFRSVDKMNEHDKIWKHLELALTKK